MSVAPYPFLPEEPPRYKKSRSRISSLRQARNNRNNRLSRMEESSRIEKSTVESLPRSSPHLPPQLNFMLKLQQASSVIAFCLVGVTLGIYAWTVYVPKIWSKEYKDLETLQRHERHLTAANESIKNQLAQQAEEPKAGLTPPKPEQAIFLPQTTVSPRLPAKKTNAAQNQPLLPTTPVSY